MQFEEQMIVIETAVGRIVIETLPKLAPRHVERFTQLAGEGFYDGCTFHRVIPGFMIQGGDPNSKDDNLANDGTGDSPLPDLRAEFSAEKHVPGIVSTARTSDPDSANCQFFIMHGSAPNLDRQYTVWGRVVAGMEVVDKIARLPKLRGDNPGKAAEMKRVYLAARGQAMATSG